MTTIATEERLRSVFSVRYERRLRAWVDRLKETPGTIVGIARKGPRLLELLVREGFADPAILDRLTSEFGLALLREKLSQIVIVDDSVINGSTFSFIFHAAKSLQEERGLRAASVIGLPFALGTHARTEFSADIQTSFISLTDEEISPFVSSEVSAFRILGKPHELEHPSVVLEDDELLSDSVRQLFLEDLAASLRANLITVPGKIVTSNGVQSSPSYALLLPESRSLNAGLDFEKLRIFVDPTDSRRMILTAIAPGCRSLEESNLAGEHLPPLLRSIWVDVKSRLSPLLNHDETSGSGRPGLGKLSQRTWIVWANYLREAQLLQEAIGCAADNASCLSGLDPRTIPSDVRLVAGQELEHSVVSRLETFFLTKELVHQKSPEFSECPGAVQLIPDRLNERYTALAEKLLRPALDEEEVLRGIFHAQHIAIERQSRSEPAGRDGSRLDFGENFASLVQQASKILPSVDLPALHASLDSLIDIGSAVPRYVKRQQHGKVVWVRVYRAGEVPVPRKIQALRVAVERLAKYLKTESVPATALEKLCVMLMAAEHRDPRLFDLSTLGIRRRFHLYGARPAFDMEDIENQDTEELWFINWARGRLVLIKENKDDGGKSPRRLAWSDESGYYKLHPNLSANFPREEMQFHVETQDAMDDIARFVALLYSTPALRTDALVTITSVATELDLHRALDAELRLWLNHKKYSIYHVLQALNSALTNARVRPLKLGELAFLNRLLSANANITAQARRKVALHKNRASMFASIKTATEPDEYVSRVWRDFYRIIEDRVLAERESSGVEQIRSALSVAARINSLLRDLLVLAGHKDPRGRDIKESSAELKATLETGISRGHQIVDPITLNHLKDRGPISDVTTALSTIVESRSLSFVDASQIIFPTVRRLAERFATLRRAFGANPIALKSKELEPPQYVVLWDLHKSVLIADQEERNRVLRTGNNRLVAVLRDGIVAFPAESLDDGNGFIASRFEDVITAFRILKDFYRTVKIQERPVKFRMGCDANVQGALRYFPGVGKNALDRETGVYGGRVYETTARFTSLFKALAASPERWTGNDQPIEPNDSYLIVGEWAIRCGTEELRSAQPPIEWPPSDLSTSTPTGSYYPDVHSPIQIGVTIVT